MIPPPIAAPNPVPVGMTQSPTSISSTPAPVTAVNVDVSETLVPTATEASKPLGQIQKCACRINVTLEESENSGGSGGWHWVYVKVWFHV
jgi:hypothetical protein